MYKDFTMKYIVLVTALAMTLPSVGMAKGTKTTTTQTAPKPAPKPIAPRPSLYSGPDYDNVLGLGNYFLTK